MVAKEPLLHVRECPTGEDLDDVTESGRKRARRAASHARPTAEDLDDVTEPGRKGASGGPSGKPGYLANTPGIET